MLAIKPIAATALTFLLVGCIHVQALPPGARYVAMGSSYAAGTALGGLKRGTPVRCGRSALNYATLLARQLRLNLIDVACGGATTAHILGPRDELPPQIEAVTPDTRLVTITIGGNDLGYVMNLAGGSCDPAKGLTYRGKTVPCPALKAPSADDYARLEANLRQIAREVFRRAPKARLIFVQYVRLIPDQLCDAIHMSPEGALLNRVLGERLAAVTARAALAEGAEVLFADQLSRQHTACDAAPWSTGPVPLGPDANAPWHPNRAGHTAISEALGRAVTAG